MSTGVTLKCPSSWPTTFFKIYFIERDGLKRGNVPRLPQQNDKHVLSLNYKIKSWAPLLLRVDQPTWLITSFRFWPLTLIPLLSICQLRTDYHHHFMGNFDLDRSDRSKCMSREWWMTNMPCGRLASRQVCVAHGYPSVFLIYFKYKEIIFSFYILGKVKIWHSFNY